MTIPFVPAAALFLMVSAAPAIEPTPVSQDRAIAPVSIEPSPSPDGGGPAGAIFNLSLIRLDDAASDMAAADGRPGLHVAIGAVPGLEASQITAPPPIRPSPFPPGQDSLHFMKALTQTMLFNGLQNFARLTRPQVWEATVEGPFFDDWFKSAAGLFDNNWSDGNKWVTNYIAHPMGGAVYGFIYRGNSKYRDLLPGDKGYTAGFFKSMAWAAVASLNHEIGPISEASFGNIGLEDPDQQAWVDPVITPTLGAVWMVFEDVIKQHVLSKIHGRTTHAVLHCFMNPSRTMANIFQGRLPWKR